jgi:hypothetical protein
MTLTRLFSLVVAFDVLGLLVASEPFSDKLLNGTAINAPFPFVAVQALIVALALRHRAAAALLTVLCFVSVISGFSDGSYAADLTAAERVIQLGIVTSTVLLGIVAAVTTIRPRISVSRARRDALSSRSPSATSLR